MEGGLVGSHGGFVGWWKHHNHYHFHHYRNHHRHHYHGLPMVGLKVGTPALWNPWHDVPVLGNVAPSSERPTILYTFCIVACSEHPTILCTFVLLPAQNCIGSVLLPAQNAPPSSSEPVPGAPTIQWVGRPGKPLLPSHTQLGPTIPVQYNTEHRLEGIYIMYDTEHTI